MLSAACAGGSPPAVPPRSTGPPLSIPALELAVLDAVGGRLAYCDPDQYPVAHGTPLENATARFPTIQANRVAYDAILRHERLVAGQSFSPDELIAIDEDYKQIQAIDLTASGDAYSFDLLVPQQGSVAGIWRVTGMVTRAGAVTISERTVGRRPECPICLAAGVGISTPNGVVPVQDLRVGMPVWTTDLRGRRIAGVVLRTGHMEAPLGHEVIRLAFSDGRSVLVSPGHPTTDGRTVGELRLGDLYDGAVVIRADLVPYAGATWDLLPSGPTGTYFANGVLLGSTLRAAPVGGGGTIGRLPRAVV